MAAEWLKIRNDYINGAGSYRELSKKYGVSTTAICKKSKAEGWIEQKEEQINDIATEIQRKTVEKISEAEAEIAAIRSRLRLTIMQELESRIATADGDGMEFRRLVQSYKDMCEITDGIGAPEENDDGFLEALNGTAEEDWCDEGDLPI